MARLTKPNQPSMIGSAIYPSIVQCPTCLIAFAGFHAPYNSSSCAHVFDPVLAYSRTRLFACYRARTCVNLLTPRVKRSAYWFLGEYCCQLTEAGTTAAANSPEKLPPGESPSSKPNTTTTTTNDLLLEGWASPSPSRSEAGAARPPSGLNGMMEAGAVAHPVVAAMNGATVSILMRLKHAAMFEDFQVRWVRCFACVCACVRALVGEGGQRQRSTALARVVYTLRGFFRRRIDSEGANGAVFSGLPRNEV